MKASRNVSSRKNYGKPSLVNAGTAAEKLGRRFDDVILTCMKINFNECSSMF